LKPHAAVSAPQASSLKPQAAPEEPVDPKAAIMAAIRENNKTLFSMVIAQAHTIAIEGASIVFTFAPVHKSLRAQLETKRAVVEQIAQNVTGKKMSLVVREAPAAPTGAPAVDPA